MFPLLIGPLISLAFSALQDFGVNVPSGIADLVAKLTPVVENIIQEVQSGQSPSAETIIVLQDIVPAIQAIKADTSIDPKYVAWATLLDRVLAGILANDAEAQKLIDPTKLHLE